MTARVGMWLWRYLARNILPEDGVQATDVAAKLLPPRDHQHPAQRLAHKRVLEEARQLEVGQAPRVGARGHEC